MNFAEFFKKLLTTTCNYFFLSQDVKHQNTLYTSIYINIHYLEPSRKSSMKLFSKIVNGLKPFIAFPKSTIVVYNWILNTPLYYLLAEVHRTSTKGSTKSFSFVKLSDNSKIITMLDYRNRSTV